ncbi:hypothetical protein Tdes44962_MAKER09008 [Teratosphaeria destructans]|uniref:Uncharacterized protein n=1 Tax=Teratosphaeria destructans TaxID=418781 RepID=A0A9W7W3Y5_9PEZI|nr:hypothetical protein Tdes44962_MAKER09008 [Teratosphaeria destructans]
MALYEDLHAHAHLLLTAINAAENDWVAAQPRMTQLRATLPPDETALTQDVASVIAQVIRRNNHVAARLKELARFGGKGQEIKPQYDSMYTRIWQLHAHGLSRDAAEVGEVVETVRRDMIGLLEATSALEEDVRGAFVGLRGKSARIVEELGFEAGESEDVSVGDDGGASRCAVAFYAEMKEYAMDERGVRKAVGRMRLQLEEDMKDLGIVAGCHARRMMMTMGRLEASTS